MRGFILAEIGSWNMIREATSQMVVHRESRNIDQWGITYQFSAAKSVREGNQVLVGLNDDGGAFEIWATADYIDEAKERLTAWAGCYGSWPVRELNA